MTDKKSGDLMVPPQGMFRGLVMRSKLILRLLGDKRVSPWVKLIPIGAVLYVVSPIDLIMGIPGVDALDDAAIIGLGSYLFLEMCPPDVVQEHMKQLTSNMDAVEGQDEVVDAEAKDLTDDQK
jgi:uncharacterized membrane protein YkvA (DUF1232 family)